MGRGKKLGIGNNTAYDAIHQYQQVSWEGITPSQKMALSSYIDNHEDYTGFCARGVQVTQSQIDRWLSDGVIHFNEMSSWSVNGGVASQFAEVSQQVDVEDRGLRSVIIVSENGLLDSAELPRTNSYKEQEVLTKTKDYEIVSFRIQRPAMNSNKSPTETIIYVRPKKRKS